MRKLDFKNKWILITGASSGLGEEMARQLAYQHKANLILLARRKDKLEQLKTELETGANVKIRVVTADLSDPADAERAVDNILADGNLYGAILNAGVTYFGPYAALTADQFNVMLQTNVGSVVQMTGKLVAFFEADDREGGIMLTSSMAALIPIPYQAAYSGTKAFILAFASALSAEIKNPDLSLTVFLPGGIATEMTANEKFNDLRGWLMPVKQTATAALYAFKNRKAAYIPGFFNRLGHLLAIFLPKKFTATQMSKTYQKSLIKACALPGTGK